MNKFLELRNIKKTYTLGGKTINALRDVDMNIDLGEFIVIEGTSGSGKTTLLNIIGGIENPDAGNVFYENQSIYRWSGRQISQWRGQIMGFVFQEYHLLHDLTVLENIMLPALISGNKSKEAAYEFLKIVDMIDRADHYPSELSGGEQQRVAIARAFSNDAPIILADEPTGNLDVHTAKEIISLLVKLHKRANKTLVVVTHNRNISNYGNTLYHLQSGVLEKKR